MILLCALPAVLIIGSPQAAALQLSSPAFKDGSAIAGKYARPAAGGHNVSIPLTMDRRARRDQIICSLHRGPPPGREKMGTLDGDKYTTGSDLPYRRRIG